MVFIHFLNSYTERKSQKRFEESVKLIFNQTVKKLKKDFQKSNSIFTTFSKIDPVFYHYYFNDTAKRLGLKLTDFYDPKNHKRVQKNLKHDYLKLLFKSEKFKWDFFSYLKDGKLEKDYRKIIPGKLFNTLLKFDKYFKSSEGADLTEGLFALRKYFRNNKQCKLPWTVNEISNGIMEFVAVFGRNN